MIRHRFALMLLAILVSVGCIGAYRLYIAVYDSILESNGVFRLTVEELPGTHPTKLKISGGLLTSSQFVRKITERRKGATIVVSVHLALAGIGLAQPKNGGGIDYELLVPDSVNEVRFGRGSELIWKRGSPPVHHN